jgi:hypothetical protein
VRSGGDVAQVILAGWIEGKLPGEVPQHAVGLLQIPRVGELDRLQLHLGLGRHLPHVLPHELGQSLEARRVQQHQAIDQQVLVLAQRHRRPPLLPPGCAALALIQGRAQETDHRQPSPHYIL